MFRALFIIASMAFVSIGPLVYAGPQLLSDLANGQQWALADDLAIKESKCTRWYFLVSTCDVEYVSRRDSGQVGGSLNYLVLGSWAGERIRLLRSTTNPSRIGTTIGLEHMQQRLISFGVFVVLALAILAGVVKLILTSLRSDEPSPSVAAEDIEQPVRSAQSLRRAPAQTFGRRVSGSVG